jgi:hypothetical protein
MTSGNTVAKRSRILWATLLLFVVFWPVIVFLFLDPFIRSDNVSHPELVQFLKVHRYTLQVPDDKDGWILGVQPILKGEAQNVGGASVRAGDQITILLRRIRNADKAEYFWYSPHQTGGGVIDDPVAGCGLYVERPDGHVEIGDYLAVGNDGELNLTPRLSNYDGELRVVLTDPQAEDRTMR